MAEKLFYNLPLNIRNKFDNDIKKFEKNGAKFTKDYIKEEQAKQAKLEAEIKKANENLTTKTTVSETNNG